MKKVILRNFTKFTEKKPMPEFVVQVFSCELCKISKNTFFKEELCMTTSKK